MTVPDTALTQKRAESVVVELGIVPGTGNGTHIYQPFDAVRPQQLDKIV
jgi:hypothetical protein